MDAGQPVRPHLPVKPTTSLQGWDREPPCSSIEWLAEQGGEKEPASRHPQSVPFRPGLVWQGGTWAAEEPVVPTSKYRHEHKSLEKGHGVYKIRPRPW